MTRSILMNFHKYTPFGDEFYEPILDFQLQTLREYENEYDMLYLIDSNWDIKYTEKKLYKTTIVKVNPSLRYYDAYKQVLPQVKEDLVLFMDNDMVVYKKNIISQAFAMLENPLSKGITKYDVVSIIDQIGTYKTDKLEMGNKLCPYWFSTRKDLLLKYLDVEWGPNMPEHETLGKLTEKMLEDEVRVYEWEEDKSDILFPGNSAKGKDLGYYHIRAGSTPAVLLAWKNSPDHQTQYQEYIKNQPKSEILRHCAWYVYICGIAQKEGYVGSLLTDLEIEPTAWKLYFDKFRKYHGL